MTWLTNLTMQNQSPSGSGSLPSNTVANPRPDERDVEMGKRLPPHCGVAMNGPTIHPTPSPLPKGSGTTSSFWFSLLKELFADELALLDPFPQGNEDDNFDPEADLRKIEYLLNRDPSTESLPKSDIEIMRAGG
ncbi:hypothetical protein Tco_0053156 [Tanacetum coccineum]